MSDPDDLYALSESLAHQLKQAGIPDVAARLSHLLHDVVWTTSSELIGELGQEFLAIRRIHSSELPPDVLSHLDAAISSVRKVWPDIAEPEPPPTCDACGQLRDHIEIRLPGQLRRILEAVTGLVQSRDLRVLPHPENAPDELPFASLSREGPWPDVLNYRFQCSRCGTYFALSAETYHGSGGEWRPMV